MPMTEKDRLPFGRLVFSYRSSIFILSSSLRLRSFSLHRPIDSQQDQRGDIGQSMVKRAVRMFLHHAARIHQVEKIQQRPQKEIAGSTSPWPFALPFGKEDLQQDAAHQGILPGRSNSPISSLSPSPYQVSSFVCVIRCNQGS